jgi:hypothetical protein
MVSASGGCSAGPRFVRACSATDLLFIYFIFIIMVLASYAKQYLTREHDKIINKAF